MPPPKHPIYTSHKGQTHAWYNKNALGPGGDSGKRFTLLSD